MTGPHRNGRGERISKMQNQLSGRHCTALFRPLSHIFQAPLATLCCFSTIRFPLRPRPYPSSPHIPPMQLNPLSLLSPSPTTDPPFSLPSVIPSLSSGASLKHPAALTVPFPPSSKTCAQMASFSSHDAAQALQLLSTAAIDRRNELEGFEDERPSDSDEENGTDAPLFDRFYDQGGERQL